MTSQSQRAWLLALTLAVPVVLGGCESGGDGAAKPPAGGPGGAEANGPQPGPGLGGGGMGGPPPGGGMMGGPPPGMGGPIKSIMRKVAQGPNSLNGKLGNQLQADTPDWDKIQAESKELVTLTKELGTHEPPKGSKESWEKLTAAFAASAADLDKAAEAKDKPAAVTAQEAISGSCGACHKEHQVKRGPGGGGFGRGGGGFGPPPGGPQGGGPPPGGEPPK